jgi:hypothetical protein
VPRQDASASRLSSLHTNFEETEAHHILQLAIESENIDAVRCLLEAGANPNDGDDDQV